MSELPILPRVGDTVDRYRVVSEIAHGGMAAVYAVQRSSIGGFEKLLAMKVMLPHLATDEHFVNMFLDEARIASQIQHPSVVQVLDVGLHDRTPFILMEFLRGQSLSRLIHRVKESDERVPLEVWLSILSQAAEGLHAAHETRGSDGALLGIVHRDVSPHNVFVTYDGQAKVVDFGIAAARGRLSGTRSGEVKGKLAYLGPEQLNQTAPASAATDIWSLGVVAWEILTGRRLFASKDEATAIWNVLNAPIEDVGKLVPKLPEVAARTLMASLSREPRRRPPSAKEVAGAYAKAALELAGGRSIDTAGVMQDLFAAERAVETERLAAAQRSGPPPPLREADPTSDEAIVGRPAVPVLAESSNTELSAAGTPRTRRRSSWIRVGLGGVAIVSLLAVAAWLGRRPEASIPSLSSAEAELRVRVRIRVDEDAKMALVNGTRHDERPLSLDLGAGDTAVVELVGPKGEMVRRTVHASDDGMLIALERPVLSTPSASNPMPAPRPIPRARPKATDPLMKNPF